MAVPAQKLVETQEKDRPLPDWAKPIPMKWWRVPSGEFRGTVADGFLGLGVAVNDGVDITGKIESLWMLPSGVCLARVRVASPSGTLRDLIFKDGHGAPL